VHNGDSDHEPSLNALISGLLKKPTPGYLLHLSGTGIVSDWAENEHLGKLNPKIWSDITSLEEIRNLPDGSLHRNTEKILHSTIENSSDKINIAIMCPPDIYGRGHGLAKIQSALIPVLIKEMEKVGDKPFYYNEGANTRTWVHIDDVMVLYVKVVEAAASKSDADKYFNNNGYYFAATQEHSQLQLARATAAILYKHGVIKDAEPVQVSLDQLDTIANIPGFPWLARYMFASNSRTKPERAEKLWGYKGKAEGLMDALEKDVLYALGRE
jgi:nucleoside-diphosphate-sugar epimerase